jgi:hypothetical protein
MWPRAGCGGLRRAEGLPGLGRPLHRAPGLLAGGCRRLGRPRRRGGRDRRVRMQRGRRGRRRRRRRRRLRRRRRGGPRCEARRLRGAGRGRRLRGVGGGGERQRTRSGRPGAGGGGRRAPAACGGPAARRGTARTALARRCCQPAPPIPRRRIVDALPASPAGRRRPAPLRRPSIQVNAARSGASYPAATTHMISHQPTLPSGGPGSGPGRPHPPHRALGGRSARPRPP